ncbi:hypothetical protein FXV77_10580 [Sphingobacterium phlebotomi]|uniref:DUF5675 domain-containing protein n=1 Tax=Sphingobacterium phlebotomi TaxID=2605433 RepID=A0A5D4HA40_9SPHI|nr:DUF5675 family protein [Sphingobacterium phlebotomi]TYR36345.1 hypothetical protein FXV77_10580 [Sphingobacterium phlebotomi]
MEIHVKRIRQGKNSTLSELYIDGEFVCYGLEDLIREEKIPGSTAIPAGRYKLAFNRYGSMNGRYKRWYPKFHKGMIELTGIPNFSYVYIHKGNTHANTAGCLLIGNTMRYDKNFGDYEVHQSEKAYKTVYKRLSAMMEKGAVYLVISDVL